MAAGVIQFPPEERSVNPLFTHSRPHVTVVEAARALAITDQQIRNLVEEAWIVAISVSIDPHGERKHLRILRSSLEAWWLERVLEQTGEEYPLRQTPEITFWREKIRARKACRKPMRIS